MEIQIQSITDLNLKSSSSAGPETVGEGDLADLIIASYIWELTDADGPDSSAAAINFSATSRACSRGRR